MDEQGEPLMNEKAETPISSEHLNCLLKVMLFVQEMYEYNKIDHFYFAFPEK